MPTKRVAILGGGVAGLTAAYELTKTPELRAQNEVTVYQMGWRLGGKAASGRDANGRNLEHGLHVWFGCYENVFRMTQEIYRDWKAPQSCPIKRWEDVAKPQIYTPIGVDHDGVWTYFPLRWPLHAGVPGDGSGIDWTPWEALRALSDLFIHVVRDSAAEYANLRANDQIADIATARGVPVAPLPPRFARIVESSRLTTEERSRARSLWHRSQTDALSFEHVAEAAHLLTISLLTRNGPIDRASVDDIFDLHTRAFTQIDSVARAAPSVEALGSRHASISLKFRLLRELVSIFGALTRGYLLDLLLPDLSFEHLDDRDLRQWLKGHGADPAIVDQSSILRVVYDTLFQFKDGDVDRPSYAAGTALGVIARLVITYKGAMMWDIQAGMGEVLIAPLYEVLLERNVSFRFFHKVKKLGLSQDKRSVQRITLKRQAKIIGGRYQPVKELDGLVCWPHEPYWDQIEDGAALRARGIDFENHWADGPSAGPDVVLERGVDFDLAVLAISMGAYKPLNDEDGSMCEELIERGGPFSDFVRNIEIVPTQSLQLWCDRTLGQLGWTSGKAATVSGPEYLNIWADMSQVLAFEPWTHAAKPKSLHYLCGTLATDKFREPASRRDVPKSVRADLRDSQLDWLNMKAYGLWPNACDGKAFDFSVLTDPSNGSGAKRFDAQYFRANISPTDCCVQSAAGTTQYRLLAHESGFDNLILAGEATRHGFNTTAIEGAAMSGMAASQAICGSPVLIPGHDFLRRRPSERESRPVPTEGSTAAGMPRYTSWIGHGAASFAAPARFTGAKMYAFAVKSSTAAMQTMVDRFLNAHTSGGVRYEVTVPRALVTFMDVKQCTSTVDSIGWVPGRECAIWIPLLETRQARLLPRPVLWAPYIFINYTIGMLTGREVWGWPKVQADITFADMPGAAAHFSCSTMTFEKLAPSEQGKCRVLFSVTGTSVPRDAAGLSGQATAAMKCAADFMKAVAAPFVGSMRLPTLSAVVLKQIRDSKDPELACYQAIVDSPVHISRFGGAAVLPGSFSLNIATCESHEIMRDIFGRPPSPGSTVLPVEFAGCVEFDFDALPGAVIDTSERLR